MQAEAAISIEAMRVLRQIFFFGATRRLDLSPMGYLSLVHGGYATMRRGWINLTAEGLDRAIDNFGREKVDFEYDERRRWPELQIPEPPV